MANGIVGRAEPVRARRTAAADEDEDDPDPRFAAADAALERGDFAAARDEFDKLLAANPGDAEAKAGKAQAGLLARASELDAGRPCSRRPRPPTLRVGQLDAADVELVAGQAEAAFARLIALVAADRRRRPRPGPGPAARAVRDPRQRDDPRGQEPVAELMAALF